MLILEKQPFFRQISVNRYTIDRFMADFRKIRSRIMEAGTDKIHFFYWGPTVLAAVIGGRIV